MNIFVTGGAGYIGSATAEALLKAGHSVTVYDSLVTGHRAAVPEGARFIQADLGDAAALNSALHGRRIYGGDALCGFHRSRGEHAGSREILQE